VYSRTLAQPTEASTSSASALRRAAGAPSHVPRSYAGPDNDHARANRARSGVPNDDQGYSQTEQSKPKHDAPEVPEDQERSDRPRDLLEVARPLLHGADCTPVMVGRHSGTLAHATDYAPAVANDRFTEGDRVRVCRLHTTWPDADRWVEGTVGKISEWHPQIEEWLVWIQPPGEPDPTLWMFADDELEAA